MMTKKIYLITFLLFSVFTVNGAFAQTENGQIHLSNSPISGDVSNFSQEVDWTKDVYAFVKLSKTVREHSPRKQSNGSYQLHLWVKSSSSYGSKLDFFVQESDLDHDYLTLDITPDPSKATTEFEYPAMNIAGFLRDNVKGDQDVVVLVFNRTTEINMPVNLAGCDREEKFQRAKAGSENAKNNQVRSSLPKPFVSSKNVSIPKLTHDQIAKMIKTCYGNKVSEVLRIVTVGSPEWKVNAHSNGVPKNRYVAGSRTMAVYKGNDGNCYFLDEIYLEQEYAGGSYGDYRIPKSFTGDMPGDKLATCTLVK